MWLCHKSYTVTENYAKFCYVVLLQFTFYNWLKSLYNKLAFLHKKSKHIQLWQHTHNVVHRRWKLRHKQYWLCLWLSRLRVCSFAEIKCYKSELELETTENHLCCRLSVRLSVYLFLSEQRNSFMDFIQLFIHCSHMLK